jgi:hypothetical protein
MDLRLFSQRAVSFLQSHSTPYSSYPNTSRFLKERNARLTIQMKESSSFYGLRLDAETQFSVGSDLFCIEVRLLTYQMLAIAISEEQSPYLLHTNLPINTLAQAFSLSLDNAVVKIEIDAESPLMLDHRAD